MKRKIPQQRQARSLKFFRSIHRVSAICLFAVFIIVSVTGLMLGWKKHSGGWLLPESVRGTSTELKDWLTLDSLYINACSILSDSVSPGLSHDLERIDVRKEHGMVKFVFSGHFYGIQLDGATGRCLKIERRRSDIIEKFHDGSILGHALGLPGEYIKLIYTSLTGLALLVLTITGFWIWYVPFRLRNKDRF
ncbi:MAG: PepSY domain-containing protein [Lentimicrobium sp.]|nr:PepSY domain-containing protein [Lentimicrobium sp.]